MIRKLLYSTITIIFTFSLLTSVVKAETITSPSGDLRVTYSGDFDSFLSGTNLYPGQSILGNNVIVENRAENDRDLGFFIREESGSILDEVLLLTINRESGPTLLSATAIEDISTTGAVSVSDNIGLLNINGDSSVTLDFLLTLDPNAGNQYQGESYSFDLGIGFVEDGEIDDDDVVNIPIGGSDNEGGFDTILPAVGIGGVFTDDADAGDEEDEAEEDDSANQDQDDGQVLGEETEENGDVAGEATEGEGFGLEPNTMLLFCCCLLLILLILLLLFLARRKAREDEDENVR